MSGKKKSKNHERSLEMKKGRKKNPRRLYFFHLNCKHLFGCKANRTFILLSRFGLIMSTPTGSERAARRLWRGCAHRPGSPAAGIDRTWRTRGASGRHPLCSGGGWGALRGHPWLRGSFGGARGAAVPWRRPWLFPLP